MPLLLFPVSMYKFLRVDFLPVQSSPPRSGLQNHLCQQRTCCSFLSKSYPTSSLKTQLSSVYQSKRATGGKKKTCKCAALGMFVSSAHSLPASPGGPGRAPMSQQVPVSAFPKLLLTFCSGVTLHSPSRLCFFCDLRLLPM